MTSLTDQRLNNNEERIRAHYTTISVVRNLINHGETIIAFAKEEIARLENHGDVRVVQESHDPRVEQLKALAQIMGGGLRSAHELAAPNGGVKGEPGPDQPPQGAGEPETGHQIAPGEAPSASNGL